MLDCFSKRTEVLKQLIDQSDSTFNFSGASMVVLKKNLM